MAKNKSSFNMLPDDINISQIPSVTDDTNVTKNINVTPVTNNANVTENITMDHYLFAKKKTGASLGTLQDYFDALIEYDKQHHIISYGGK